MIKALRYITIILICSIILFLGYKRYTVKQAEKVYVDLMKTTIVTQLEALNRLETASMTMQKTVAGKQGLKDLIPNSTRDNVVQNFLFEDSIELIAMAKVTAGFDLSTLNSGSVVVNHDKSITLILPKAQILQYSLLPDTKPFLRKRGLLNPGDIALETEVRNQTLEKMKNEALEKGILINAEENATEAFRSILGAFNITLKEITIQ